MILVLTASDDATADYFCARLSQADLPFLRFDTDRSLAGIRFATDAGGPSLTVDGATHRPSDFSAIWLRRPGALRPVLSGDRGEAHHVSSEWAEAFEGFLAHVPAERWINHPSANAGASHKVEQLTRAQKYGLPTPETLLTQSSDELLAFWQKCDGRVLAKPLSCGYIERDTPEADTQIFTSAISEDDLLKLDELGLCPTLFQGIVDKVSDVRVTVFDERITCVKLLAKEGGKQRLDIRRKNMVDVAYKPIELPGQVRASLLSLLRSYGLRFAAVDFVIDRSGRWIFLEINPNGQWAWLDLVGGASLASDFLAIIESGLARPSTAEEPEARHGFCARVADILKTVDCVLTWLLLRLFGRDTTYKEVTVGGYEASFNECEFDCQEDDALELVLQQAEKMYEQERQRRESVSDKCKTFLQISAFLLPLTGIASRSAGKIYIFPAVFLLISAYLLLHILDIRSWRSVKVAPRNVRQKKPVLQRRLICDYLYAAHDNKQTTRYLVDILKSARSALVIGLAMFPVLFFFDPFTTVDEKPDTAVDSTAPFSTADTPPPVTPDPVARTAGDDPPPASNEPPPVADAPEVADEPAALDNAPAGDVPPPTVTAPTSDAPLAVDPAPTAEPSPAGTPATPAQPVVEPDSGGPNPPQAPNGDVD